jgi:hypothetical protein
LSLLVPPPGLWLSTALSHCLYAPSMQCFVVHSAKKGLMLFLCTDRTVPVHRSPPDPHPTKAGRPFGAPTTGISLHRQPINPHGLAPAHSCGRCDGPLLPCWQLGQTSFMPSSSRGCMVTPCMRWMRWASTTVIKPAIPLRRPTSPPSSSFFLPNISAQLTSLPRNNF